MRAMKILVTASAAAALSLACFTTVPASASAPDSAARLAVGANRGTAAQPIELAAEKEGKEKRGAVHPELEQAREQLRAAIGLLRRLPKDYEGHRVNAIQKIEEALGEIRECKRLEAQRK